MNKPNYTNPELLVATQAEWITRDGSFRFPKNHPIVKVHVQALSGLLRAGGLVIDAPTSAKASNIIRRMRDENYDPDRFGTMAAATAVIGSDLFHQFDVWGRGTDHVVTAESMRPKLSQTLRRIIARLPERGIRPNVAIQVVDDSVVVTAYRLS